MKVERRPVRIPENLLRKSGSRNPFSRIQDHERRPVTEGHVTGPLGPAQASGAAAGVVVVVVVVEARQVGKSRRLLQPWIERYEIISNVRKGSSVTRLC